MNMEMTVVYSLLPTLTCLFLSGSVYSKHFEVWTIAYVVFYLKGVLSYIQMLVQMRNVKCLRTIVSLVDTLFVESSILSVFTGAGECTIYRVIQIL